MASPGLELLFELVSREIIRPQDPLVCFIHWELISRGLRCLGINEQAGAQETGTEQLPDGWANNKELYTLRYGHGTSQILLKALTVEGTLMVNAMELQSEKVSDVTLNIEDFIDGAHLQQYHSVYKNPVELKHQLEAKLFSSLLGSKKENVRAERARERPADDDPLRVPTRNPPSHHPPWTDPLGHFPYGAADLDPLGQPLVLESMPGTEPEAEGSTHRAASSPDTITTQWMEPSAPSSIPGTDPSPSKDAGCQTPII